jgi:hypothetical protein
VLSAPVIFLGGPDLAHDTIEHARWAHNFARQFWTGEGYPRWLSNVNGGLGSPVFFFYPPLPSYASAIFWPLLKGQDPAGWRIVGLGLALAMVLSGLAAFFWLRHLTGNGAALFGSVVYMIGPYHAAIDLYNRGAVAEFWTFVWMPCVLLCMHWIAEGDSRAFLPLAVSYSLLIYTHLAVTLCFSPFLVAAAFLLPERGRLRRAFGAGIALLLGTGLGAPFLFPAMLDQRRVHIELQLSDWFDYRKWWLFQRPPSLFDYRTRMLVFGVSMLLFMILAWWIIRKADAGQPLRRWAVIYSVFGIVSFLFTTQLSAPFWKLPYLPLLQFPSRFLAVTSVSVAALAALALAARRPDRLPAVQALGLLILLVWVAADAWAASAAFSRFRAIPAERANDYRRQVELQREYASFWPRHAALDRLHEPSALAAFLAAHPARSAVLIPAGEARVLSWTAREIVVQLAATTDSTLVLGHFYYPGWKFRSNGAGPDLPVGYTADGLLQVHVPAGSYRLAGSLGRSRAEQSGLWTGMIAGLIACGVAMYHLAWRGSAAPARTLGGRPHV